MRMEVGKEKREKEECRWGRRLERKESRGGEGDQRERRVEWERRPNRK